jgi:hypothetical protein
MAVSYAPVSYLTSENKVIPNEESYVKRADANDIINGSSGLDLGRFKRDAQDYEYPMSDTETNKEGVDLSEIKSLGDLIGNDQDEDDDSGSADQMTNIDALIGKLTKERTLLRKLESTNEKPKSKEMQNKSDSSINLVESSPEPKLIKLDKNSLSLKAIPFDNDLIFENIFKSIQGRRNIALGHKATKKQKMETKLKKFKRPKAAARKLKNFNRKSTKFVLDWPSIIDNDSEKTIYESFYELLDSRDTDEEKSKKTIRPHRLPSKKQRIAEDSNYKDFDTI